MQESRGHHPELSVPETISQEWLWEFNTRYAFGKYATTVVVEAWLEQSDGDIGDYTLSEGTAEEQHTISGNVYNVARAKAPICRELAFTDVLAMTNVHRHLPDGSLVPVADGRVVLVRLNRLGEQLKLMPLRGDVSDNEVNENVYDVPVHRYQHMESLPVLEYDERQTGLAAISRLDPELLTHSMETKQLVELSLQFWAVVTQRFGEPLYPKWASGTREIGVLMTYHNGGEDGHTSFGWQGMGVPRAVLLAAAAINQEAVRVGKPVVFDPIMRASALFAAAAHDSQQLCGRSLLPEGKGPTCGDERMSAEDAYQVYRSTGQNLDIAHQVYRNIMATSFDPRATSQNVVRTGVSREVVLGQELTAVADLFHLTRRRGALSTFEYACERLFLGLGDRIVQQSVPAKRLARVEGMRDFLILIEQYPGVKSAITQAVGEASRFALDYQYPDLAIREACGKGIDELFPNRHLTAAQLATYATDLEGGSTVLEVWESARTFAGYKS